MQTAAVALALRSAIADVQAAVEAVDEKVSDIQKKVRSREVGEVVGTYRFLQRVVDSTRQRGQLLEADWDQVAGARRDLEIALESLRAYVTETTSEIDAEDSRCDATVAAPSCAWTEYGRGRLVVAGTCGSEACRHAAAALPSGAWIRYTGYGAVMRATNRSSQPLAVMRRTMTLPFMSAAGKSTL